MNTRLRLVALNSGPLHCFIVLLDFLVKEGSKILWSARYWCSTNNHKTFIQAGIINDPFDRPFQFINHLSRSARSNCNAVPLHVAMNLRRDVINVFSPEYRKNLAWGTNSIQPPASCFFSGQNEMLSTDRDFHRSRQEQPVNSRRTLRDTRLRGRGIEPRPRPKGCLAPIWKPSIMFPKLMPSGQTFFVFRAIFSESVCSPAKSASFPRAPRRSLGLHERPCG